VHLNALVVQPPTKAPNGALRKLSSAMDEGQPFGQADGVRLNQTDHHPGQCLEMP
jgi:hypothetical protein